MLHLASSTDPAWVARALASLDEVLVDHAHCEKKAASTAVSLLFRYPDRHELARVLSELAREELAHFARVLAVIEARGLALAHQRPAPYAQRLMAAVRATEPERLVDTLLCMALIEARSCERMQLLASACPAPDVAALYRELLESEARHHATYVDLATAIAPDGGVARRLAELAAHEASVIAASPPLARLHA